ncbi:HNH endonuclease signature motif containing protein [Nocardiopsis terrae]|uniref:HNH endonuclease signature motif containing protein n=1 Tax=Streptomyces sp. NPDC057554 TaxID=3350538 RepID=UPI0036AFF6A5
MGWYTGALNRTVTTRVRGEQKWMRRNVFGGKTDGRCVFCGEHYPDRMETAHIKPRWQCIPDEQRDPMNVMAACWVCHRLYDDGDIRVDQFGIIRWVGGRGHEDLRPRVEGRKCAAWSPRTRHLFHPAVTVAG